MLLASDSPIGPLDAGVEAILDKFTALGVMGTGKFGLAVIDVPPDADLSMVRHLPGTGHRNAWWDYDELCVTDVRKTATSP
ncbi:hypothetical protein [Micromonospora sp. NPDC050200]|uniref:hypothetical protein n=1 Tax=Micromonospora sp. NPDC050200 TaxID=3155664 RepID=UPI0033F629F5